MNDHRGPATVSSSGVAKQPETKRRLLSADTEIQALSRIGAILDRLSATERDRVLSYLGSKYEKPAAPAS